MDYDTIEALVEAPFQKEQASTGMELDPSHHRKEERLPSVDLYHDSGRSRSPRSQDRRYSEHRGYSREREYSREKESRSRRGHRRSRSRSPRHRDYRDPREYDDYNRGHRDYRDSRDYEREYRRSYSRERQAYRSRSPRYRRSPSPPADESTCDRRTVFVMQLSARVRSSELHEFFTQAGKVRAARIIEDRNTGRSKGVGYVEFYDEESVAKAIALTGQKILGIPVIAKHTESEKNRLALQAATHAQEPVPEIPVHNSANDISQHRLYIGSVNFDLTEDDLKQVLEPFGAIEFVKLHRDPETGKSKGFAFVQYQRAEDAKQALSRLNGYELAGRIIKVGMVTDKATHPQQNGTHQQNDGPIDNRISIDDSDTAGYAMTNLSRAELMQKLARGDVNLGAIPTPPGSTSGAPAATTTSNFVAPRQLPVVMPSRSVLLKNMFTEEDKAEREWAKELEEDVREEAEKCGHVVHIHVEQESVGEIFLKFDTVQSATNAVQSLGGRFFAGRQIIAAYLPEMLYNVRFPRAANL
ncbi:hypothetical protein BG004_002884 [Podila humilis]|nr:hypothetical protein BG004_002884 [Podila humilis]